MTIPDESKVAISFAGSSPIQHRGCRDLRAVDSGWPGERLEIELPRRTSEETEVIPGARIK